MVLLGALAKALSRGVHWDPSQGKSSAELVLLRADLEESWCLFLLHRVTHLTDRRTSRWTRRLTWLSG